MAKFCVAVFLIMISGLIPDQVGSQECQNTKPDWIFCEDFETGTFLSQWQEVSHNDRKIRETNSTHVYQGRASLKLVFPPGDLDGGGWMHYWWKPATDQEEIYLRWYVKYGEGFEYGRWDVKMAGLEGHLSNVKYRPSAGVVPDGTWFQSRVISLGVKDGRGLEGAKEPFLYYYHPGQDSRWGDFGYQNHKPQVALRNGRWHCIEMRVKPNTVLENPDGSSMIREDGEQTLWIDGALKAHYTRIPWRRHRNVQINDLYHSAWVGKPTAQVELYRWEDNYVVSKGRVECIVQADRIRPRNWFISSLGKILGIE